MKFKSTKRFVRYLFENTEQKNDTILALSAKKFFETAEGKNLKSYFEEFYGKNSKELQNVFLKINNSIKNETKNINEKEYEEKIPKEVSVLATDTAEFIKKQNYNMIEEEENIFEYLHQYLLDTSIIGIESPKPFSGPYYSTEPRAGETLRPTDASRLATAITNFPEQGIDRALGSKTLPKIFTGASKYLAGGKNISARPVGFFRESKFDLNRWQKLAGIKLIKG